MPRATLADQAKAQKLANYDRQIEQLERKVDKLVEHRNRFAADFDALGADAHLPEGWSALRAIEDWLVKHDMKPTVFGRRYFNDPRFVSDLRNGRRLNALNQRKVRQITRKPQVES